jgi:glycosyltransferase involved in cell wall biosynthesis
MNVMIQTHYTQNILKNTNGGLEVHINQLLVGNSDNTYYVFMPNEDKTMYILTTIKDKKIIKREYWDYQSDNTKIEISSQKYSQIIHEILVNYSINLVHIHNCIGHTFDTPIIAKKIGIKTLKSVHDMYDISGEVFKSDYSYQFDDNQLKDEYGLKKLEQWKQEWIKATKKFYMEVDQVIFFSQSTRDIYLKYFKINKYSIIPHGIEYKKDEKPLGSNSNKFVYIGRISVEKGIDKLIELFNSRPDLQLYLFGPISSDSINLIKQKQNNIYYCGVYSHEELKDKLESLSPKAAFILANWPETFNYVLSEVIQLGILPIVSNQGALPERVNEKNFGIILEKDFNIIDLNTCIDNINYTSEYKNWSDMEELPTVNHMVEQYIELYQENMKDRISTRTANTKITGIRLFKIQLKYLLVRKFINTTLWKNHLRPIIKK